MANESKIDSDATMSEDRDATMSEDRSATISEDPDATISEDPDATISEDPDATISEYSEDMNGVLSPVLSATTPTAALAIRYWSGDTEKQRIQEMLSVQLGPMTSCFHLLHASMDEAPFCRDKLHDAIQRLPVPDILKIALDLLLMIQTQASQETPSVATSVHSVRSILRETARQPDADNDEPPRLSVLDIVLAGLFWELRESLNTSPFHYRTRESPAAAGRTAPKIFPYPALFRLQWLGVIDLGHLSPWGATKLFTNPWDGNRYHIHYGVPRVDDEPEPPDCDLSLNQRRVRLALTHIWARTDGCTSVEDLEAVRTTITRDDLYMDEVRTCSCPR